MNKSELLDALRRPLPGKSAQLRMAPTPRPRERIWDPPPGHREAAVLVLLYPHCSRRERELHLVFIERPIYAGVHSGQIAFPGGRRHRGESLLNTALRETREEIGVRGEQVEVIGELSSYYVSGSNHNVFPFVGFCEERPEFVPCSIEVAQIIEAPLARMMDQNIRRSEIRELGKYGKRNIPYFDLSGKKLWGATAMMFSEFLALVEEQARDAPRPADCQSAG